MGRTIKDRDNRKKTMWRMKRERRRARQAKEQSFDDRDTNDPPRRLPPNSRLWRPPLRETNESD